MQDARSLGRTRLQASMLGVALAALTACGGVASEPDEGGEVGAVSEALTMYPFISTDPAHTGTVAATSVGLARCEVEDMGWRQHSLHVSQAIADEIQAAEDAGGTSTIIMKTRHTLTGDGVLSVYDFFVVRMNGGATGWAETPDTAVNPGATGVTVDRKTGSAVDAVPAFTDIVVDTYGFATADRAKNRVPSPLAPFVCAGTAAWEALTVELWVSY
jgi:hypothetical protein